MEKKIELDKVLAENMIEKIKYFFANERDEEIGDLSARMILDFITENIAPEFYNKGIKDCIAYMHNTVEDLYSLEL